MDQPNPTRSSSQDEPQRGASGAARSASATPDVHNRSPSSDSAFSRSGTQSDSQSSNAGAVIHNYHYHCCNHHGPNAQCTPAATANLAAPAAQPSASSTPQPQSSSPQEVAPAPAAGFDVYQQAPPHQPERSPSSRLGNLERDVDRLQHHLSSAFYRIAETRVENRRLRRLLDQSIARQVRRSPQRRPHLPVAPRHSVAHRGRSANARHNSPPLPPRNSPTQRPYRLSPQHRDNSPPYSIPSASIRRGAASPAHHSPAVRGCHCANCASRNWSAARRSPTTCRDPSRAQPVFPGLR